MFTYSQYRMMAFVAVLLWPVGTPLVMLLALYIRVLRIRTRGQKKGIPTVDLGILIDDYRAEHWYWEVLECCESMSHCHMGPVSSVIFSLNVDRKLLLTGVILFCWPGSIEQIAFGLIITILCLCLYAKFELYVDSENSNVQITSQLSRNFLPASA
jgi:hypothetical protein